MVSLSIVDEVKVAKEKFLAAKENNMGVNMWRERYNNTVLAHVDEFLMAVEESNDLYKKYVACNKRIAELEQQLDSANQRISELEPKLKKKEAPAKE